MSLHGQPETDEGRIRILDAAADAFMRRGIAKTTMDDIADGIGATKGLIYYQYRSKFDIFLAVYAYGMHRVQAEVEQHVHGPGTGRERLTAMAVSHVLNLMRDIGYHHVIHQGVRDQASIALNERQREALTALNEFRRAYETLFRSVVEAGIADGSLRSGEPKLMARTLLSSLNAVDSWFRPRAGQRREDIEALAQQIVALLIGGLAAPA